MARFYSNENFPLRCVQELRQLGHDVLTSLEAGKANLAVPDEEVLTFAATEGRAVLTLNRKHFVRLHRHNVEHSQPGGEADSSDPASRVPCNPAIEGHQKSSHSTGASKPSVCARCAFRHSGAAQAFPSPVSRAYLSRNESRLCEARRRKGILDAFLRQGARPAS